MKHSEDRTRRRFFKVSSMLGLTVAFSPGTIIEAFAGRKSRTNAEDNMTQTSATQPASERVPDKTAIRPFQFNFPDAELIERGKRRRCRWVPSLPLCRCFKPYRVSVHGLAD
jgi:hypothetical protein